MQPFELIFNILLFLIVLTLIISIHELGHFLLAKRAGILIHEFSIGMGPTIVTKKKGDTSYSIRAIPLGGYVAMSGENGDQALISKGSMIGINLNEIGLVKEIVLDQTIEKRLIEGEVIDFDLYGKNLSELFIDLKLKDDTIQRFQVTRDAKYVYQKQKSLQITPEESSFSSKTIWERFLVLFFGPLMNFLLALVILFIVAIVQGKPLEDNVIYETSNPMLMKGDVITEINGTPTENIYDIRSSLSTIDSNEVTIQVFRNGTSETMTIPVTLVMQNIGIVNSMSGDNRDQLYIAGLGGKASAAGLNVGDLITHINGNAVTTWSEVLSISKNYQDLNIEVSVLRDGEQLTYSYAVLSHDALTSLGVESVQVILGFQLGYEFDLLYTLYYPFQKFGSSVTEMVATIRLLFTPTSGVGVGDLAGPVGIFSLVSNAAKGGFVSLMVFTAFLSVNIGLMNLLPIPALDGGRLVFLGYEAITKKKIPAKFEGLVNNGFFILLLLLFVYVTWNDILRLFT
ncbi:Putative zinc metalloprotease SA1105 [Acholeplasma oculi]|uniref:Membrane-associated metallopeptidase, M50 family n=1 Tax=Acholeplasma oculi TaxID=35623 RepID=A0A061AFS2_9MOLU|nr:RIP metalloprotease RseP [Acholeplasma oculi]CDR30416.1 Membrane-associated metallopeptidase, M50 family [Acholeplasma oculi]SKC41585.1 regulator of sigma E protease [Acholeplasma oculi]SUT88976.1 Putative zinc metalloprotease SA1105 [Acholeplasma oculi]